MSSVQFGLFVPQGWRLDLVDIEPAEQWSVMSAIAAHADAGPWNSIWVYDHFHTVPVPTDQATHEAWTLMSAFAATTHRVKLGQMCTAMSYRNPAYLAKVAATVDIISGGRTQMGIGAGWYEHEWHAYGYGFPSARERLERLDEGVQIMRAAWADGQVSFTGQHYQVDGAICAPQPLQVDDDGDPTIPLWIAGGGEKRTLKIAAQYADYTNFDGTPTVFAEKSAILQRHCDAVGTDFDAITRSANYNVAIGNTTAEVEAILDGTEARIAKYAGPQAAAASMNAIRGLPAVGTVDEVIANFQALRELGMTYAILNFPDVAYDSTQLKLFETEVIPALQAD